MEAFSDGVLAIVLTIMVLELKVPHGNELSDLAPLVPVFLCYVLSFIYIAIYWNNHHHLLHTIHKVNGPILWANTHLLFWLSLIPFSTAWLGENEVNSAPVFLYGVVLIGSAFAYTLLTKCLIAHHGNDSTLAKAIGKDLKGKISLFCYALGLCLSFFVPVLSICLYAMVALMWLIPDQRIEKKLGN